MLGVEEFYSTEFKDELFKLIDKARADFDLRVRALIAEKDQKYCFGSRFNSDKRVLNEILSAFCDKGIPSCFWRKNEGEKIYFVIKILFECARTDHYYAYEKEWY